MLRSLRDATGGPSVRSRVLAAVVALAALLVAAPVVLLPLLRAVLTVVR